MRGPDHLQDDINTWAKLRETVEESERDARFIRQARWLIVLLVILFSLQIYAAIFNPFDGYTIWQFLGVV